MQCVLIIDDSKVERLYASIALVEAGYDVLEAEDGASGIEMVRQHKPDCILLDVFMPDMSGQDVLRNLQRESLEIPVIVVTGTIDETTVQDCLSLGAHSVIEKPRLPEVFVDSVRDAIGS